MEKKVLLFDVDGTLTSYDGVRPESMKLALKQARENGHLVFVVTGRTKQRALVGGIEVDGMICGNGAYIEYHDQILKDLSLSLEAITKITDDLDANDFDYFLEGNHGFYGSKYFDTRAIETYEKYGCKKPVVIRELYPMIEYPESMHQEGIIKVNYILHSYEDYLHYKEKYSDFQCLTWGGQGEEALFGDIATKGIDKQLAIQELIDFLQVKKEDIYSFGDAEVDIPMFKISGTSICVGSGREKAKEAADYITDAVKEDGIYNAMKHFNLI